MVLTYPKDIKDNVFYITVKCKELGTVDLTKEQEKEMLINFPISIEYKDLKFEKKFNVDSKGDIVEDSENGETVTLKLNNKVVDINENLEVNFQISTKMIKNEELGTILNTKEKVAEAKAFCFKLTLKEAIEKALKEIRNKSNNFENQDDDEVI